MHRGNAAQFRIDFRNKRAELQLFRELAGVEIANRARLNFAGSIFASSIAFFPASMMMCRMVLPSFFRLRLKSVRPAPKNVN
jgi:hypothetical protein